MAQISRLRDADIVNGLPNDADDVDAELDQLVSAHNTNDTTLSAVSGGTYTFTGAKSFSSPIAVNTINPVSGSLVTVGGSILGTTLGVSAAAGTNGYFGVTSTFPHFRVSGVNYNLALSGLDALVFTSTFTVNTNSTLATGTGQVILASGFITLSIPVSSSLATKWCVHIINEGTGLITIDPNGAETINGVATLSLYPGESCTVMNTSSGVFTAFGMVRQREVSIFTINASNSTTIDFTGLDNSAFRSYIFRLENVVPVTDATTLWCRFSTNGGSSYAAGGSDYIYSGVLSDSAGGTVTAINSTGAAQITLSPTNTLGNGTGEHYSFKLEFPNPSSALSKSINGAGGGYSATPRSITTSVSGTYVGSASGVNAIRFMMSSGNISSGTFECIGVRV